MKIRIGTPCWRRATALGVPEAGRRVDLAGGQRGDRVEADRHPLHLCRVAAVGAHLGVDHRFVGGQAGDADGAAFEVAGPGDAAVAAGDHGGQRSLHQRHRADQVDAALAGDAEVVDVEDGEVGAARGEQLRRVGRFARLADRQVDALVAVVALVLGRVDARSGPRSG